MLLVAIVATGVARAEEPPEAPVAWPPAGLATATSTPAASADGIRLLERVRGLSFRQPVGVRVIPRPELRRFVEQELEPDRASGRLDRLAKLHQKLGLASEEVDLAATLVELYADRYVGFYDPRDGGLTLIDGGAEAMSARERDQVVAHELVHALQDQHFGLERLREAAKPNDDRALALTALVEGDATLGAALYGLARRGRGVHAPALPDLGPALRAGERPRDALDRAMPHGSGRSPEPAAAHVDGLYFGYVYGTSFCQAVISWEGSYGAIDHAFADPPRSTEQILHPERYLARPRDDPIEVALPSIAAALGPGWTTLHANVMGELYTRLVLARFLPEREAAEAAEGWGGDRYEAVEGPDGEVLLVWLWVGDTARDAEEFARAYGLAAARREPRAPLTIEREGDVVWIVDGARPEEARKARGALRAATIARPR